MATKAERLSAECVRAEEAHCNAVDALHFNIVVAGERRVLAYIDEETAGLGFTGIVLCKDGDRIISQEDAMRLSVWIQEMFSEEVSGE